MERYNVYTKSQLSLLSLDESSSLSAILIVGLFFNACLIFWFMSITVCLLSLVEANDEFIFCSGTF